MRQLYLTNMMAFEHTKLETANGNNFEIKKPTIEAQKHYQNVFGTTCFTNRKFAFISFALFNAFSSRKMLKLQSQFTLPSLISFQEHTN